MKAFDPDYKLLDEMYQDDYYPAFLVTILSAFSRKSIQTKFAERLCRSVFSGGGLPKAAYPL